MSRLLNFKGVAVLLAALFMFAAPAKKAMAQPNVSVTFQTFYNDLQPYGQWIDNAQYGYCWVPNVDRGFRPYYSNGYWVMTEYGNTWVSNYSWGWAPFHYGNWTYDDYYGWIWVPGTTWGPAWVSWRNGGGHYGWAPIAPGISITVATSPRYYCSNDWWIFVPQRNIYSRTLNHYWRGARYNTTYINQTTIINNTYINNNQRYACGPRSAEIHRATGQQVRTYGVRTGMKPGRSQVRGNSLNIYRPTVQRGNNTRPQRVVQSGSGRTNNPGTTTNNPRGQRREAAPAQQRTVNTQPSQRTSAPVQRTPQRSAPATTRQSMQRTPQRSAPAASRQPMQRAQQNNAPVQSRSHNMAQNTPANRQPQQQGRITERRQQSWQHNNNQPAQRSGNNNAATSRPTRTQTPVNRNVQRARPQSQSRPQRSSSMQRSPQPQQRQNMQRSSGGSSRSSNNNSRRR